MAHLVETADNFGNILEPNEKIIITFPHWLQMDYLSLIQKKKPMY